jgi:hypothetical protein
MLVRLSRTGFYPQGSDKRFQTHFMFAILLFQASWHNLRLCVKSLFIRLDFVAWVEANMLTQSATAHNERAQRSTNAIFNRFSKVLTAR